MTVPALAKNGALRPDDRVRARRGLRTGVLLMLAGTLSVSGMDVAVKIVSRELPVLQIAWARYLVLMLILFTLLGFTGGFARLASRRPGLHVFRAVLLLVGAIAFIAALRYLPLAEANVLGFASPLLVTALSRPVLGEPVGAKRWLAVAAGFVGIIVVVRPGGDIFQWAAALPLVMAACAGVFHVLTPLIARTEDPGISLYYVGVIGTALLSAAMIVHWEAPSPAGWVLLLVIGILGTVGQLATIRAFQAAPAAILSPMLYSFLIWALLFGWLFFGEVPDLVTLLGAAIIIGSGIYVYRTG